MELTKVDLVKHSNPLGDGPDVAGAIPADSKNRRLTLEERKIIEDMLHRDCKHKDICDAVKIHATTLYREFKKCKDCYNAEEAHHNTGRPCHPIDYSIIGKRFGLLTVVDYANKYNHRSWWKCQCDCGKTTIVNRRILVEYCSKKRPQSCGCIAKQFAGPKKKLPMQELALRKFQDMMAFRVIKGECWEWTGHKQKGKMPRTSWRNKAMSVRKCMYLIMNDTTYEPNPVFVNCGNLNCFNPDHITLERPMKRVLYEDQI